MMENRAPSHFIYLFLLAVFWGSAFMFIKISLGSIPPLTITAVRIIIGMIIIVITAFITGAKLPREYDEWFACMMIGITGLVIPFILISWGVQYIPSSLAAICMSFLPLFTIILTHYMTYDEKFSHNKLFGIIIGMLGVASLFYGTISGINNSLIVYGALAGLFASSFFYALSGVLIKKLKNKNPLSTSAAMLITATIIIIPIALIIEEPWNLTPTLPAVYALLIIGIFATGLSSLILFHVTHLAGATFTSYSSYLIPLVGMAIGNIWLDEAIKIHYIVSVLFIFTGIYLADKSKSRAKYHR